MVGAVYRMIRSIVMDGHINIYSNQYIFGRILVNRCTLVRPIHVLYQWS